MKGSSRKRKEYVLNEYVINELKKPHVSNTPLESFPWLRPALFLIIIINAFDFCQK